MKREAETAKKRNCILVLGMHRSGTSALTRVLNIAGAALPKRLMGASDISNTTGHWEPDALIVYHDRLLAELGSSWHDWQALDMSCLSVKRREEISQEIREIVDADYGDASLIVLKDPRICRFAPFFFGILQDAGFDISPVIMLRNPLEVCESLELRGGMKRADAALLWLRHVLDAEKATRGMKRAFITYNHFLENWKEDIASLTKRLNLNDFYTIDEIEPQVEDFLSLELRHHVRKIQDVLLDPLLRDWIGIAYQALLVLARNPGSIKAMDQLDAIAGQFNNASLILHRLYDTARTERSGEIEALRLAKDVLSSEISGFKEALSSYEQKTAEFEREADELKQALSDAESKRAELTAALSGREEESAALKAALSEAKSKTEELEQRLLQTQGEASQLEATLAQRGEKIAELKQLVDEREALATELEAKQKEAEEKTSDLTAALGEREQETTALKEALSDAESQKSELETHLSQAQGEAGQLEATLAQRGEEIAELKQLVDEKEALATEFEANQKEAEEKTAELTEALLHQRRKTTGAKSALTKTKNKLEKQEQEASALKIALLVVEAKEADLKQMADEREREISGIVLEKETLANQLQEKATSLQAAEARINEQEQQLTSAHDQTRNLEDEFKNSTSWKLTAPLRAIAKPLKGIKNKPAQIADATRDIKFEALRVASSITRVNSAFDLLAARSIQLVNAEDHDGEVRPTNTDPQIIINLEKPLSPGWYEGKARIQVKKGTCCPRLYFDLGNGCEEYTSARMIPTSRQNEYSATFFLPIKTSTVRFDPTDDLTSFVVQGLELKRLSTIRKAMLLGGLGFTQLRSNPRLLLTRMTQHRALSKQQSVLDLTAKLQPAATGSDYQRWIAQFDYDDNRDRGKLTEQVEAISHKPLISVVMPVYNTPMKLLDEAIQSVVNQVYPYWELCIANDASSEKHVRSQLDKWAARDKRIKVMHRAKNGHISKASNSAINLAKGEWIALLDHDDLLRENALAENAIEINQHPDAEIIYSDEDKLDDKGQRYDPYFKPDFSRELFRSQNYLNHLTLHKATHIKTVGGWRTGYEGSQDYDLNLRIFEIVDEINIRHIPKVLYHWRAVAGSTAVSGSEKSYAYNAGKRALEGHIARIGLGAVVEKPKNLPFYRVRIAVPKPEPLVTLIIPTRDGLKLLRNCIESIYEKTTYRNYEIIVVDNNSKDPAALAYMSQIAERENLRVLRYRQPFNFSAINNFAVNSANGSIIGLINNDIEVISTDWLTEMVSWAVQSEVGCVGAKLYYGNDTIQHAGVILGVGGVAGHSHKNYAREHAGYFSRLKLMQNLSAVTAACLLVRKSVYEQVGGLNETDLTIAFNDVDFCLKVREAGYNNVWTPYAELYHLESVSRGKEDNPEKQTRFAKEVEYIKKTWGDALSADPYYSPHLTRDREDFSILT